MKSLRAAKLCISNVDDPWARSVQRMEDGMTLTSAIAILILIFSCCAPVRSATITSGYDYPSTMHVAPGQVVTLFVPGAGKNSPGRVEAGSVPLPTSLAGLSVTLRQSVSLSPVPVPIFSVAAVNACTYGVGLCGDVRSVYAAITVQIPFELEPYLFGPPTFAALVVRENGVDIAAFPVLGEPYHIHVLRACDSILSQPTPFRLTSFCDPVVTHADGTLISKLSPAKADEILILYAVGLGAVSPRVRTGESVSTAAQAVPMSMGFDFNSNASAKLPPLLAERSIYSGLTPWLVGLYQVNFKVPAVPPNTPGCSSEVRSNLTVTIGVHAGSFGTGASFDGAGICVKPD